MDNLQIPLPPDDLMIAVSGHARHEDFGRSRLSGPAQLQLDFTAAGIDVSALRDVLDFGCGCGRVLAGWAMRGHDFALQGCDYNHLFVEWCNENIPGVRVQKNEIFQPIPYPAASFDLIYLLSVFTHLDLPEERQLVSEFRRVLRPGGYLYVTFHGEHFYPQMLGENPEAEANFQREGFLIGGKDREGENDCWTLHTIEKLMEVCAGFRLLKHFRSTERGPTDVAAWQDSAVFQLA